MYVKVRVETEAKNECVRKVSEASFAIAVREKAANNAANKRVVEVIAAHFGIPEKRVRIVSGHHRPSKLLLVALGNN